MLKLLTLISFLFTLNTFADTKLGIIGSLYYNTSDTDEVDGVSNIDEESEASLGVGVRAIMGVNDQLHFRSGAGFIQKKWSYEIESGLVKGNVDASVVYLNIPLTLYWKTSPKVGIFGGTNLQAKLDDDADSSGALSGIDTDLDANTIVLPLVLGFDFNFTEQFAMELSYEYGIMETAEDTNVSSGVLSLVYNFPE